jgi:AraC-like DNA-binding protein
MSGQPRPRIAILGGPIGTRATWAVALSTGADTTTISQAAAGLLRLVDFEPDVVVVDTASLPPDAASLTDLLRSHPSWAVVCLRPPTRAHVLPDPCPQGPDAVILEPFDINTVSERAGCLLQRRRLPPIRLPRFSRYVVSVIEHFGRCYQTSPSMDALAEIAGVSRSHLTHGFRSETGMAAIEYLAAVRVRIAKELLGETDFPLAHVARQLGFCDASHFSRVFRSHTGRRPGRYRRASRPGRGGEPEVEAPGSAVTRKRSLGACG